MISNSKVGAVIGLVGFGLTALVLSGDRAVAQGGGQTKDVNVVNTPNVVVNSLPAVQIASNQTIGVSSLPAVQIGANQSINVGNSPTVKIVSPTAKLLGKMRKAHGPLIWAKISL